jgi:membrane-associated phospholipid phosphatase
MPRSVKMPLLGAAACLLTLVPLAILAYKVGPTSRLDQTLLFRIVRPESSPLYGPAEVIRLIGELPVVVALVGGLVLLGRHFGRRREALVAAAVVFGAGISTELLKFVFAYPRFQDTWWTHTQELAFPSGHATAAASLSIGLLLVVPPVHRMTAAAIGLLVTGSVGISVIVLGWHYPSDVLGGFLVASAWGLGAVAYLRFRSFRDGAVSSDGRPRPRHLAVSTD